MSRRAKIAEKILLIFKKSNIIKLYFKKVGNMNKKPFGLNIAVKAALQAIKEGVAPPSVALSNLFYLQKSDIFPQALDVYFFNKPRIITSEAEKKILVKLLDNLKQPNINKETMLEDAFAEGWIFKKSPPKQGDKPISQKRKPSFKNKTTVKNLPTVVVKKTKLG